MDPYAHLFRPEDRRAEAVRWRYTPGRMNDRAVDVLMMMTVVLDFVLD